VTVERCGCPHPASFSAYICTPGGTTQYANPRCSSGSPADSVQRLEAAALRRRRIVTCVITGTRIQTLACLQRANMMVSAADTAAHGESSREKETPGLERSGSLPDRAGPAPFDSPQISAARHRAAHRFRGVPHHLLVSVHLDEIAIPGLNIDRAGCVAAQMAALGHCAGC